MYMRISNKKSIANGKYILPFQNEVHFFIQKSNA